MFGIISAKYTKVLYAYIFKYVNSLSTTIKKMKKRQNKQKSVQSIGLCRNNH